MINRILIAAALVLMTPGPLTNFAHGGSRARVEIEPEVASSAPAGKLEYKFQLADSKQKITLKDVDLAISHEKKVHFVAFDAALQEFQHVHPEFVNGMWTVSLEMPKSGSYKLWAQGKVKADGYDFSAPTQLTITGGNPANPTPPKLKETRTGADGNSAAAISSEKIQAKKMIMLNLTYSRKDGTQPEITPYLGAKAHVFAVPVKGDSVVHVHPMDTQNPNQLMIHATFPVAGMYRVWIEFIDGGVYKRVPFAVSVTK